jgi:DNA invertase Pin-like site-specific DNA recombinase
LSGLVAKEGRDSPAGARAPRLGSEQQRERGAGLEKERRALAAACRRRGWQPLERREEAERSSEQTRPGRAQALADAEASALVAAKRARLAQALPELAALLGEARQLGFALLALDCALAPARRAGEERVELRASFAPCAQGLHAERIRAGLAQARARGVRLGRPPTMAPYVLERIRREREAGKSLDAIAHGLNADRIPTAQGGLCWYPATIRSTLMRVG